MPLLIVAIVLAVATICAAAVRLTERAAINPWEPAIAMEAMRLNAGLPLYEAGHASHMYGPLLTVALAGVFRVAGLNLLAARIIFSILALGLAVLLSRMLCRAESRKYLWLALLLFLGINFRTNLTFFSAQPDCAAALLAVIGLCFWIKNKHPIVAVAFFVCGMLFKQTAAAFALIPIVHAIMWQRPVQIRGLTKSVVPLMSILLTLGVIRFVWPQMFAAIVTVPASIKVYPGRVPGVSIYLIASFPLFLAALVAIWRRRGSLEDRERWILSALIVLIPVSIWTICKSGGSYNSLLPAYLAMTALFVAELDTITAWLRSLSSRSSLVAASAIALVVLFSFFAQFDRAMALLFARHGDDQYEAAVAVAVARQFGDHAISPQDPTIAYCASGQFGRSLFFELDTHAVNGNWPTELPMSILQELRRADYVIAVHSYVPTPVFERGLRAGNFHPAEVASLDGSAYTLWTRK